MAQCRGAAWSPPLGSSCAKGRHRSPTSIAKTVHSLGRICCLQHSCRASRRSKTADTMESDIPTEIGSVLQGASINRHPSVRHDANPSTAASKKQPVTLNEHPDPDSSEVGEDEIPVSVLDPVPRQKTMPPLPDLRFEQSYLKSIEQAEGWQGVLWITLRDQVRLQQGPKPGNPPLTFSTGHNVLRPRRDVDSRTQWLATLEPFGQVQWTRRWCADTEMVVGSQQLVHTKRKVQVEGHQVGKERNGGKCGLLESLAPNALLECGLFANSRLVL